MDESPLEKLIVALLGKKFPAFCGSLMFITAFTRVCTGFSPDPDEFSPHPPKLFL